MSRPTQPKSSSSMPLQKRSGKPIQETSAESIQSSGTSKTEKLSSSKSIVRKSDFFRGKVELWAKWFRQPQLEIAEAITYLRHTRGLSQAELAEKSGTKQPEIARIESGRGNMTMSKMVKLAEALDATILVSLEPVEMIGYRKNFTRWWDRGITHCGINDIPPVSVRREATQTLVTARLEPGTDDLWRVDLHRRSEVIEGGKLQAADPVHISTLLKGSIAKQTLELPAKDGGDYMEDRWAPEEPVYV